MSHHRDSAPRAGLLALSATLGVAAVLQIIAVCGQPRGPWFQGAFDDFTRDLIGAAAVDRGLSPYQPLSKISDAPDKSVVAQWVAHTPASIVAARAVLKATGDIESAALGARLATAGVVVAVLLFGFWRRKWWLVTVPLLSIATSSFALNWLWNQHGVVVAILLAVALRLHSGGKRSAGIVILGLIVSIKPWLLPTGAFLPSSRSAPRDLFLVGAIAAGVTLCCLPAIGGWESLRDWLTTAMPSNYQQWVGSGTNQSLTAALSGPLSFALLLSVPLGIALAVRDRAPQHLSPVFAWLCIVTLPQLIWSHYLVDASPLILFSYLLAPDTQRRGPLLIGLATVLPSALALSSTPDLVGGVGLLLARGLAFIVLSSSVLAYIRRRRRADRRLRVLDRALGLVGAGSDVPRRPTGGWEPAAGKEDRDVVSFR